MKSYSVALSIAGHDKGTLFAILGFCSESYALVADGRHRKVKNPKKKKLKHLKVLGEIIPDQNASISDRELWKALREFKTNSGAVSEGGCKLVQG